MLKAAMILAGVTFVLGAANATDTARDAVIADPDHHLVVMENDHVRVIEARAGLGATSPMHSHSDYVLVSLASTRLKLTMPDGQQSVVDVRPGQVLWMENAQHGWEILAGELHAVAIEVKSAARSD